MPTIAKPIRHEVHRPCHIWRIWHRQRVGFVPLQPLAGLDPQVQFQLAVDAVNAFVVPRMTSDVAQVQETQPEPLGLPGVRQADQKIRDFLVLGAQLWAITIAGLADTKGPAGQRNADLVARHC
jgi:hypothetical protein